MNKNGLHLTADMTFCLRDNDPYEEPRKYGEPSDGVARKVQLHLCSKKCDQDSK